MRINIPADSLRTFFEDFNQIIGYCPGVADKFLLEEYVIDYKFFPLESRTIVQCFLREYDFKQIKPEDFG